MKNVLLLTLAKILKAMICCAIITTTLRTLKFASICADDEAIVEVSSLTIQERYVI